MSESKEQSKANESDQTTECVKPPIASEFPQLVAEVNKFAKAVYEYLKVQNDYCELPSLNDKVKMEISHIEDSLKPVIFNAVRTTY